MSFCCLTLNPSRYLEQITSLVTSLSTFSLKSLELTFFELSTISLSALCLSDFDLAAV